ncbi:MAG: hypothetical protein ACPGSB_01870 [Opitutales bacterium]
MAFILLLVIALVTIAKVETQSAEQRRLQAQARQNALTGLQLAVGEMQKHSGPDTRVTASADIVDQDFPPLTGVWRSWEGSNHESSGDFAGRPIQPDYDSKGVSVENGGRFVGWLVSGFEEGMAPSEAENLAQRTPFEDSIALVSEGSLPEGDEREVHLLPTLIEDRGAFAWWVSGENQKARINSPAAPESDSALDWSELVKSRGGADPGPFGLDALLSNPSDADKLVSLASVDLITGASNPDDYIRYFHDMSLSSVGLMTNVATGGWRKDLSLVTENWFDLPEVDLPFFRLLPDGSATSSARPERGNHRPEEAMLYPWADYRNSANDRGIAQIGPVSSWHNLMDYATAYKRISENGNGDLSIPFTTRGILSRGNDSYEYLHFIRNIPVVARIHWVFSHRTVIDNSRPAPNHRVQFLVTPVVTMWNPYNVSIESDPLTLEIRKPLPCAFSYNGGANYYCLIKGAAQAAARYPSISNTNNMNYRIASSFTLGPGETRVFSPAGNTIIGVSNNALQLTPGYRPGTGHVFNAKGAGGNAIFLNAGDSIDVDVVFDTEWKTYSSEYGVGMYIDVSSLAMGQDILAYRMRVNVSNAREYWQPIPASELASTTAGEVVNNPKPFLSTVFGSRVSSNANLASKGLVQTSPLTSFTTIGSYLETPGNSHPANAPFDFSFFAHAPGGDSRLPNADQTTNRGYIVSGFDVSDGLSRIVLSELPLRPLASLAELQNWDLRYDNPVPPFQFNIIGNSDAQPLFSADSVYNPTEGSSTTNLQYDDAYCANHLLFDDWFFSSIAPIANHSGGSSRSQRDVYLSWLEGETPLINRAYLPIPEDSNLGSSEANDLFDDLISDDGWQRSASRFVVKGMFNVNSTSVTAWRSLLGNARGARIPYIGEDGGNWPIELSAETDYAFSRFSVAGDVEAGQTGTGGDFPDSSEFTGYRVLEAETLLRLAEEIVEQIRRRGPFLSLSEFVNRQLANGSDTDLALAGAIQAALNVIAEDPNSPYEALQDLSSDSGVATGNELDNADYVFPEAAVGKSAYGLPGWTRQADVLRPLAPILSARDDTFTIRAYGDARAPGSDGEVTARAWCEATVRRVRDYVDPSEPADLTTAPTTLTNQSFGRRYEIVSFRWLDSSEI